MFLKNFEYAGRRLTDFNCMLCSFDDVGLETVSVGTDISFTSIKNRNSSIGKRISADYGEDPYSDVLYICKNTCNNENQNFSQREQREIIKWLNRPDYYKFKPIYDVDSDLYYMGSFNLKAEKYGDDVIGFELTFTANAPFGFAEKNKLTYSITTANTKISLSSDSDDILKPIYPKITIIAAQAGNITITNTRNNSQTILKNLSVNETIILDGEHGISSTSLGSHITFPNDFNYEFLKIITTYDNDKNEYLISAPCQISIEYKPIRKVGI